METCVSSSVCGVLADSKAAGVSQGLRGRMASQRRRGVLALGGFSGLRNLCACGRAIGAQMAACVAPGARPDRDTEAQRFPCARRIFRFEKPLRLWPGHWRSNDSLRSTRCAARSRHRGAEVSLRSEDFPV